MKLDLLDLYTRGRPKFESTPVRSVALLSVLVLIALTQSIHGAVTISEFQASGPDWIELFNDGDSAEALDGLYLTDDASDLTKWPLPDISLAARQFLLVHATGDDRRDPAQELHTNFRLAKNGEYLALVRKLPNDSTVVLYDFGTAYPPQFENISYGSKQLVVETALVPEGAPVRYLVPDNANVDISNGANPNPWIANSFSDGSWTTAHTGLGYATQAGDPYDAHIASDGDIQSVLHNNRTSIYIRIPFNVTNAASFSQLLLNMRYDDGFAAYLNGNPIPIAKERSPASNELNWLSTATQFHPDEDAITPQPFSITDFQLLEGSNVLSIHGLNRSTNSSDALWVPELIGLTSSTGSGLVFFATPSPGRPNDPDGVLLVKDTQFSHKRGYYQTSFSLTISSLTDGAVIRYTTDGSVPEETGVGTTYTSPITIDQTTIIRARAFKAGFQATNIDTQSYIFPADVVNQGRPSGYPAIWGSNTTGDYDVDTDISQSGTYQTRFIDGLYSIPTLSVTGSFDDVFGPGGIYLNTENNTLEAPVTAELFHPEQGSEGVNNSDAFNINCGLKIQGGFSRLATSAKKHSLSLRFRAVYGESKLNYPVFPNSPVKEYNALHMRAGFNNTWTAGTTQRARALYLRDQWARSTFIDMGNPDGGHGQYVHVYLNGLYWGLYNLHERLDNDHFASYTPDVSKDDIISYHPGNHTPAEDTDFQAMRSIVSNGNWSEIEAALDVDKFIDFYIVNHFGHNGDLKPNDNWRAVGSTANNQPWRIYCWDTERIIENQNSAGALPKSQDGVQIISNLDNLLEFQVRFADRAYKHLHHDGALANQNNRARILALAGIIDTAIVCESARWGDIRSGGGGPNGEYTRDDNWIKALHGPLPSSPSNGILGSWFPTSGTSRTSIVINNWKTETWPGQTNKKLLNIDAPEFTIGGVLQHGGMVPDGLALSATAPSGTIYYTVDGSDPRLVGGSVSSTAQILNSSINLSNSGLIRMRAKQGSDWSPLNEANFFIERFAQPSDLRITEIHYHPYNPDAFETAAAAALPEARSVDASDFKFIEIQNISSETINLFGVRFTEGLSLTLGNMILAPSERFIIVEDIVAFGLRYSTSGITIAGQWIGTLDNDGERLRYETKDGQTIEDFTYNDNGGWPDRADGDGSSLELKDTSLVNASAGSWKASREFHGSPGIIGIGSNQSVLINEILAHTDLPQVDQIELYNITPSVINIGGWYLSDSINNLKKYRIPDNTIINGHGYITIDETQFNQLTSHAIQNYSGQLEQSPITVQSNGHGLVTGDLITITGGDYDSTYEITRIDSNAFTIPRIFIGNSSNMGTWSNGKNFALSSSLGENLWLTQANSSRKLLTFIDQVRFGATINGVSFGRWLNGSQDDLLFPMTETTFGSANSGPQLGPVIISEIMYNPTANPDDHLEFIELHNISNSTQPLNHWTLRGGVDFDFTSSHSLPAGETLVIVDFNPATEIGLLNSFRTVYGIGANVTIIGPWETGSLLNNAGDRVTLHQPDTLEVDFYPQVLVDTVTYGATSPWPASANGTGNSLIRSGGSYYGPFVDSWLGSSPTPGSTVANYIDWISTVFGGTTVGSGPTDDPDGDGRNNTLEYAMNTNPLLSDASGNMDINISDLSPDSFEIYYTKDLSKSDITYQLQESTDLKTWLPTSDTLNQSNGVVERRSKTITIISGVSKFYRILVEFN